MGLPQSHTLYSPEEYLALERKSNERHEYLDGYIYEMSGESIAHSAICTNLAFVFVGQLKGRPCQAFSPNMKVRTKFNGLYSYPDLSIVCGQPEFHDNHKDIIINPKVIVEVLSPSTEAYNRGEKWIRYQEINSLSDYLLVSQDQPLIEHFSKQEGGKWLYTKTVGLESRLYLTSIDCQLQLSEIYDKVTFPDNEPL
jgi:Uma2 family endonuclease